MSKSISKCIELGHFANEACKLVTCDLCGEEKCTQCATSCYHHPDKFVCIKHAVECYCERTHVCKTCWQGQQCQGCDTIKCVAEKLCDGYCQSCIQYCSHCRYATSAVEGSICQGCRKIICNVCTYQEKCKGGQYYTCGQKNVDAFKCKPKMHRVLFKQADGWMTTEIACSKPGCCNLQRCTPCRICDKNGDHWGDVCVDCQEICCMCNKAITSALFRKINKCPVCHLFVCDNCSTNGICNEKHKDETKTCPNCSKENVFVKQCYDYKHEACESCYCRCKKCALIHGKRGCKYVNNSYKRDRYEHDMCGENVFHGSKFCPKHDIFLKGHTTCTYIDFNPRTGMKLVEQDTYPHKYYRCLAEIKEGDVCKEHEKLASENKFKLFQ